MYEKSSCKPCTVTVILEKPVSVKVPEPVQLPVVKVLVPGIQGASATDKPLDVDPLEIYLSARGNFPNDNDS